MKQKRRHGHGRRLLEIGKDILIVFLVLVNVTLAIMCLPTKTLTQTKWLASALRPFAGLFGLNEAELTYTAPATGSAFIQPHASGSRSIGSALCASSTKTTLPGSSWSLRSADGRLDAIVSKKATAVVTTIGARQSAVRYRVSMSSKSARQCSSATTLAGSSPGRTSALR